MTLPSVRAWGTATGYSGTNNVANKPAGTIEGDLMIAFMTLTGSGSLPWSGVITAGWTMVDYNTSAGVFNGVQGVAYKYAGSSEPSSYAFNMQGGGCVRIASVQDAAASGPFTYVKQSNGSASTTINIPSVTTPSDDCLLFMFYGGDDYSAYPFTHPSGTTEVIDFLNTAAMGAATEARPTAGATGARTATQSANQISWAMALAVSPASLPSALAGNVTLDAAVAAGTLASSSSDLGGNVTLDAAVASGTLADAGPTALTGNVTLDAAVAAGTLGLQPGVITSEPLKTNNGTVLTSMALAHVCVYDDATGALIVRKTGVSTNAEGIFAVTDAAIVPGTTYRIDWETSAGHRRMPRSVAA